MNNDNNHSNKGEDIRENKLILPIVLLKGKTKNNNHSNKG